MSQDDRKTKKQLIEELVELRRKAAESESGHRQNAVGGENNMAALGKLANSLDNIQDGLVLLDKPGTIVYVNQAAADIFSGSKDELIGKHFTRIGIFSPKDIPGLLKQFKDLLCGGDRESTLQITNKLGRVVFLESSVSVQKVAGGSVGVVAVVRDVTERKQAEERLKLSERRFSTLVESAPIAVYETDAQGKCLYVNRKWRELAGMTLEDALRDGWQEGLHKEDRARLFQLWKEHAQHQKPWDMEYRFCTPDGKVSWVMARATPMRDADGRVTGYLGANVDITERKEAEARVRLLLDNLPCVAMILKKGTREIVASNNAAQAIGAVPGATCFQTCAGRQESCTFCKAPQVWETGQRREIEVEYEGVWYHGIWVPLDDDLYVHYIFDITERKQAEEALAQSEERFRKLFQKTPLGYQSLDEEGRFLEVNDTWCQTLGYSRDEVIGRSFAEFINPGFKDIFERCFPMFKDAGSIDGVEHTMVKKDGSTIIASFSGRVSYNDDGSFKQTHCIFADVTERKLAEEALQASEERFRTQMIQSPMVMEIYNLDGLQIEVNQAYEKLWGFPASITVNKFNVLESKEVEETGLMAYVKRAYAGEAVTVPEYEFDPTGETESGGPGRVRWLSTRIYPLRDSADKVTNIVITHEDITDRKKAEQALRESEEKYRRLFEHSNDPIFVHSLKGEILDVNDRACEMLGYSRDQLLSMTLANLHREEEIARCGEAVRTRIQEGSTVFESTFVTADGSILDVSISSKIVDPNRGIIQGIVRDMTETRRLQELESRAERLETAGTIASQVAHDFNNLLAPLMAYPEFIREDLPHDHEAHAYLDAIEEAAKKIADINQDLLTMGRRGHYNQDVINLNRVVLQAAQEMESRARTVTCDLDLCEDLMNIKGGAAQIHRVLINLLANAQDAMQDIGQITIRTENYYADDTSVAFGRVPRGEYVKLSVSDNGCGIPDDVVQKILDPFFTTKITDKKRGSGLGLSVVDAVMKDHDGHLDLSSKVGHGTTFFLYFPVTREGTGEDESEHPAGGTETILVVDDDEIQRDVSIKLLTRLGYGVRAVESGEKAVEFLKEHPHDLMILDMVMPPGVDGVETYRRVLEIIPNQKAIIVSGFSESDRVIEALRLGAGAFIKKPLTRKAIAVAVREELDRKVKSPVS